MNNKIMYDSFELLYVYIKKIDRCFEDTYFSFTNDYDIEYDYDNKRLKIVKKDSSVLTNSHIIGAASNALPYLYSLRDPTFIIVSISLYFFLNALISEKPIILAISRKCSFDFNLTANCLIRLSPYSFLL